MTVKLPLRTSSSCPGVVSDKTISKRIGVCTLFHEVYPIQQSIGRKGVVQFTLIYRYTYQVMRCEPYTVNFCTWLRLEVSVL